MAPVIVPVLIIFLFVCLFSQGSIFPSWKPSETIFKITFWLGYFNSCINPIIYPCSSQEFKRAFHSVLRGHCLRTGTTALQRHLESSAPALAPNTPALSDRGLPAECSLCCCRMISSSSVMASDEVQRKTLLKSWCFSASQTAVPHHSSHRSTKVSQLSLGFSGEAVWLPEKAGGDLLKHSFAWRPWICNVYLHSSVTGSSVQVDNVFLGSQYFVGFRVFTCSHAQHVNLLV